MCEYQVSYINAIQQAIESLMSYFFDNTNINKVAHYAFSDQKILRDSYMKIHSRQAQNLKQLAMKQINLLNLRFFGFDFKSLQQQCSALMGVRCNDYGFEIDEQEQGTLQRSPTILLNSLGVQQASQSSKFAELHT